MQASDGNFYGTTSINDTAYKISSAGKFTSWTLPGFGGASPLIQGSDGKLYGTIQGYTDYWGWIFSLTSSGQTKTLYSFDYTHGAYPQSPLVQGSDGNFYGTTCAGGAWRHGVAFKLTPKGGLTVLHDFDTPTGACPAAGLVLANDGAFYGAAAQGGTNDDGVLFRMTASGVYSVLYNFDYDHGSGPTGTPMQHTNGKIYGLAGGGGAYGVGVFYGLDVGLKPFVKLMTTNGKAGQTVEILGQGFTGTTSVMFGTGSASFTVVSDTYLTAKVPASGTTGYVTVATPSGTLTSSQIFKVLPVITSFTPISGPVGTKVKITGSGFIGATKVTFGGVKATSYSVDSGTQITATVPAGAKTGNIAVTTPGGTANKGTFTVS